MAKNNKYDPPKWFFLEDISLRLELESDLGLEKVEYYFRWRN